MLYRQRDEAEIQECKQKGAEGKLARLAGSKKSFGKTNRDRKTVISHNANQQSYALALRRHQQQDRPETTNQLVEGAVERAIANPLLGTLEQMGAAASKEVRVKKKGEAMLAKQRESTLQSWIRASKQMTDRIVTRELPGSDILKDCLLPVPLRGEIALAFEVNPNVVNAVSSLISSQSNASNLQSLLLADWSKKHEEIMHDSCPPLPTAADEKKSAASKKPECWTIGLCLCSDAGHKTYLMRNAFLRSMKAACQHKSKEKDLLVNGNLVARLRGVRLEQDEDPLLDALDELNGDLRDRTAFKVDMFWHVAYVCLCPYMPTVRSMRLLDGQAIEGELHVQAQWGV